MMTLGIRPEWTLGWQRLGLEDVERGTCDCAVLQRLNQRLLVDDFATRDIDEERGRLHLV